MIAAASDSPVRGFARDTVRDAPARAGPRYVFADPVEVEELFRALAGSDAGGALQRLLHIAEHQTVSVSQEALAALLGVLDRARGGFDDAVRSAALRLILELTSFRNADIAAFFASPEALRAVASYFPAIDAAKVIVCVMDQVPEAIGSVMEIFGSLMDAGVPLEGSSVSGYLYFYPRLFKAMNQWSPMIGEFVEMLNNVITNSNDVNLVYDAKSALKKIVRKYRNAAEQLLDKYYLYCNFDPTESLENIDTIKILTAAAASLDGYLFVANEKILNYIHLCLTTGFDDGDDMLLFFTLDFFLQSKEYSGLYDYDFFFKDLVQILNQSKYKIQVKIIRIICRFLMVNDYQKLCSFLECFQIEVLFDFLEDKSNLELQVAVLECFVHIKSILNNMGSSYFDELISNNNYYDIIENASIEKNDDLSSFAKLLL